MFLAGWVSFTGILPLLDGVSGASLLLNSLVMLILSAVFFVGVWRFKQRYRLFNDLQQRVTIDLLENDSIKFKQYIYLRQKNSALGARQLW
jgi:hypothetical protein